MAVLRNLRHTQSSSVPVHEAFPLGQIEQGLGVRILEHGYSREHAPAFLLGEGVDERGGLSRALDWGWNEARQEREAKVAQILEEPLTIGSSSQSST